MRACDMASRGRLHITAARSSAGARWQRFGVTLLMMTLAVIGTAGAGSAAAVVDGAPGAGTPSSARAITLLGDAESPWTVQQLSETGKWGFSPSVSGDYAVWKALDPIAPGSSIMSYRFSTATAALLSDPASSTPISPDIGGSEVVWIDRLPGRSDFTVMHFNLETQVATPLYTDSTEWYPASARVDDGAVVWLAITNVGDAYTYAVLHSDVVLPISTVSSDSIAGLDIDGPWVTWRIPGGPNAGVYLCDSRTPAGAAPIVGADPSYNVMGSGTLVYTADGDLILRDLEGGTEIALMPAANVSPLAVGERWLIAKRLGITPEETGVFALDLETVGGETPAIWERIPVPVPYADSYGVDGDHVVFAGSADDPYMNNAVVYLATRESAPPPPSFLDVPADHPYRAAIEDLARAGIVGGYPVPGGSEYRPQNLVWRAQFAKMICEVWDLEVTEADESPFTDLEADDPASLYPHEYVAAAARAGITTGLTPTTFGPYLDISRAQVITMIVRSAQQLSPGLLKTPSSGYVPWVPPFSDVHDANLAIAEYNGLLKELVGYGAAWDPWANATRGEVAQMLHNLRMAD